MVIEQMENIGIAVEKLNKSPGCVFKCFTFLKNFMGVTRNSKAGGKDM